MACDEDGSVCKAYGASSWVGGALGLASRVSVLVDADGTVRKTYPNVSVASHADDVLADLEALGIGVSD
jgi:peroxiredoxin Q/BCP